MKRKSYSLMLLVLSVIISVYVYSTFPRNIESFIPISEVKSITLNNTVHKSPSVNIENKQDIKDLFEHLNSYKFKRKFLVFKPLGSEFSLSFQNVKDKQEVLLIFISRDLVRINNRFYEIDQAVTDMLITRLVSRGFAEKADIFYAKEVNKIINRVSSKYGESQPVVKTTDQVTVNSSKPMYLVELKGIFTKGDLKSTKLTFSMLADGSYVWMIEGRDDDNNLVWEDNEL